MTQIRISIDLKVEKGDVKKVLEFLSKPTTSKQINDFAAHVLVADEIDGTKIKTVGGNAHVCEPTRDYACGICREVSKAWPNVIYPRSLLAR